MPCASPKLGVQPPALPSSPRAGAEGLEPGQILPFLPQMLQLGLSKAGVGSEQIPPGCREHSWIVVLGPFNQECSTTMTKCEI